MCQQAFLDQCSDVPPTYIISTNTPVKIDCYLSWMGYKLNKHYIFPVTVYSCDTILNNLKVTAAKINTAVRNDDSVMPVTTKWHPNVVP